MAPEQNPQFSAAYSSSAVAEALYYSISRHIRWIFYGV